MSRSFVLLFSSNSIGSPRAAAARRRPQPPTRRERRRARVRS